MLGEVLQGSVITINIDSSCSSGSTQKLVFINIFLTGLRKTHLVLAFDKCFIFYLNKYFTCSLEAEAELQHHGVSVTGHRHWSGQLPQTFHTNEMCKQDSEALGSTFSTRRKQNVCLEELNGLQTNQVFCPHQMRLVIFVCWKKFPKDDIFRQLSLLLR